MTEEASIQKARPCDSCPFMAEGGDRKACFEPDVLDDKVGGYLRNGGIHPCHSSQQHMCAGYLSFAEQTFDHGAAELQMVRIHSRFGGFDFDMIDTTLPVYQSFDEMLEDHGRRLFG